MSSATPPRKLYRKSRDGCGHCKRRKIKCDESKPECGNCLKRSIKCDYPTMAQRARSDNRAGGLASAALHSLLDACSPAEYPHTIAETPLEEDELEFSLNMTDLQLLHNYTTSTCMTISTEPDLQNFYRVEAPRIAFANDFVMRTILAVSALHLARFNPTKRDYYISLAMGQHKIALRGPTAILPNITKDNCLPIFVFSALTIVFALATPRNPDDFLFIDNGHIPGWLQLLRGTKSIALTSREWSTDSPGSGLGSILRNRDMPENMFQDIDSRNPRSPGERQLLRLRQLIVADETEQATRDIHLAALDSLSTTFQHFFIRPAADLSLRPIFSWACTVSDEYLHLLARRETYALIIFAYFSVLLHKLDCVWWIQGWGKHLVGRVYYLIEPMYQPWIQWPLDEIKWVPAEEQSP
ncbi:uncharacterized protein K452DRAFT_356248 [Aplosporella prunicola CBS 121167]|uniref:Zn(2)-C6 fungal-type domain-containing protein n=1 Tax=Aplosporella prunicola CBS 121167 TaxID=1176127 RepID=A0A6A6BLA3_9PEZI|nr:uncharacterized protein K452DRAFT_356248 [Aplosporella prunicola CBS 121167]KAF2144890.1 hypothetical protein K452DRAFT_356248 [Aplosporella prunicola CBS 121167]